jgi:hypothetical protein
MSVPSEPESKSVSMSELLSKRLPGKLRSRILEIARENNIDPQSFLTEIVDSALVEKRSDGRVILEGIGQDWRQLSPNDLVDPDTASRRLKISKSKLAAMRCRGTGPKFVKMGARTVYYRICDLDDFINGCLVQSTSQ